MRHRWPCARAIRSYENRDEGIKCFLSLLVSTWPRICRGAVCVPLLLSWVPPVSSPGRLPDSWWAFSNLPGFWWFRFPSAGARHFLSYSGYSSSSTRAIPSNKSSEYAHARTSQIVPPSSGGTCFGWFTASRPWKMFFCGFLNWKKWRSSQSRPLSFEPG